MLTGHVKSVYEKRFSMGSTSLEPIEGLLLGFVSRGRLGTGFEPAVLY